jgi:hypothetical protein
VFLISRKDGQVPGGFNQFPLPARDNPAGLCLLLSEDPEAMKMHYPLIIGLLSIGCAQAVDTE